MLNVHKTHLRPKRLRRTAALMAFLLTMALAIGLLAEGLSAAAWRWTIPDYKKSNIRALSGERDAAPAKVPNTFWHHDLNPEHPLYREAVNPKGTLGPDFAMPKPPGELRIICLGDSTVEGDGVKAGEAFPALLETLLRGRVSDLPGFQTVRVINAGVGSHNSAFNLAYLAFRLLHYQPDILIIKSSFNDYLPFSIPGMGLDYTHAFPNPYHGPSVSGFWRLARHSYFLKILGAAVFKDDVAVPFPDFSGNLTTEQALAMDASANAGKFYIYGENIRSMILLSRGRGVRVLLLDLPTSPDPRHFGQGKPFGGGFKNIVTRLEGEMQRIAAEEKVTVLQTGPFDPSDFWDHCHMTPRGNLKVAEKIALHLTVKRD